MSTVYLAGFPRSGSTLLCNILNMHEDISSTPSSPLCNMVGAMRRNWSDDPFLLAQLDSNFEQVHNKLIQSTRAFMDAWSDNNTNITIDKNRGWLFQVETLKLLYPDFKIIICLRDIRDIYASIEQRHRKTLMMEFPDHMEHNLIDSRASALFDQNGLIGNIWKGIYNLGDVPDINDHIYYWRYEDFLRDPQVTISNLFEFLKVKNVELDFNNIPQLLHESDSYYRMKYPHSIKSKIEPPTSISDVELAEQFGIPRTKELVSPRILDTVLSTFNDYYFKFYPEVVRQETAQQVLPNMEVVEMVDVGDSEDSILAQQLDEKIQEEVR